jgi:hydrogenase maturation protease
MNGLNHENTHLFAIGNSGRQDDGLGWALAEAVEKAGAFKGKIHYRYQLQVEDADVISSAGHVIFIDAFKGLLQGGYAWQPCVAGLEFHFSTHAIAPESILYLCQDLYGNQPEAHCLLIQGEAWELEAGLTEVASNRLNDAISFLKGLLAKEA